MSSRLNEEIRQIAGGVRSGLGCALPALPARPDHLYTLARGSSLHAGTIVHHLMSDASLPSSHLSLELIKPDLQFGKSVVLAISQSGASPDLCRAVQVCSAQACPVIALVNMPHSRLEQRAWSTVFQCAGEESAVAATKSMVCSVVMGARLAMHWGAPAYDLHTLPTQIETTQRKPIGELAAFLATPEPLLIIGGGSGLGVAGEIALKAQELLARPAMAYSPAEVLHGPAGMIGHEYPVLVLATGPAQGSVTECAARLAGMGAKVHSLKETARDDDFAALLLLTHVYLALELACRYLGRCPDQPANLRKVTLTG